MRQRLARTSAAPGKTRLANIYRVARGAPLYLVDLPGYGYAGGDAGEFERIATAVFGARRSSPANTAALLLVDARHPGLDNDLSAWAWVKGTVAARAIVATKIDKLSRAERLRAIGKLEAVFEQPVGAVSAHTGEGLDELWKLIDRLANNNSNPARPPLRHRPPPPPNRTAAAETGTDRPRRRRRRSSSSRRSRT